MKNIAYITLLSLWFFAIAAPSIITLCDVENPVIVSSLNEEEQQKTGKKFQGEEKIVNNSTADFSLIAQSQKSQLGDFHSLDYIDYTQEILVPPPERIY